MGLFDYVNFKMPCPRCGSEVGDFQSKSAGSDMVTVEPEDVTNFYSACDKCKAWIEFYRERPTASPRKDPLTTEQVAALGFRMEVTDYAR